MNTHLSLTYVWKHFLSMMLVLLLVSACGNTAAPTTNTSADSETDAPSSEPVTLTIWATGDEDEGKLLFSAAERFMAENPNVTIELQPISWDDAHAKVLSAATSGTGPDIITGGLSWGIEFGQLGGMIDLRENYPDIVAEIEESVHQGIYQSVVSPENEVYGVPWDLTVYQMFYRPDLLEEITGSGEPPATWDELTTAISQIQDSGKKGFAMQWGNTQWLQYFNFLTQAGGALYDETCSAVTINSPEAVEALTFYTDLYSTYNAPTDGWPDLEGGMVSGDYPIGYTGSWIAGSLDASYPELEGKWTLAPLAAGPTGDPTAFIGGRVIGIMSYSEVPDTAVEFIRSIYNDETADAMTATAAELNLFYIPPRADFADKIQAPEERVESIKAQLANSKGPPNCTGWEESSQVVEQKLQQVIFEGADPQTALDEAAVVMTQNLTQ